VNRVEILGVGFDTVNADGALERIAALAARRTPHLIVTANVEMVMAARRDPDLHGILARSALVVADGVGVVWGSRWLGRPLPGRVPGIDLAVRLCGEASRRGWRVYLLGGAPGVAAAAAARLRARYPEIVVVGTAGGFFDSTDDGEVVRAIREASPTLLLAGLGAPRQERWLSRRLDALGVPVVMGVGGTLDVWAGRARRAPRVMQALGLEWCYRLIHQPRRIGRQLAIPHFMAAVCLERLRAATPRSPR
jgi:N-acetylglucosaminyldiphosphoundecaprenol N-acetyl-beta-D-mannosaminyltransferase